MSEQAIRLGFRCHRCRAIDFCHVDWARRVALCGACLGAALVAGTTAAIVPATGRAGDPGVQE